LSWYGMSSHQSSRRAIIFLVILALTPWLQFLVKSFLSLHLLQAHHFHIPMLAAGGATATILTHPMDVAKTLMQTSLQVVIDHLHQRCCLMFPVQRPLSLRATLAGVVARQVWRETSGKYSERFYDLLGLRCTLGGVTSSHVCTIIFCPLHT
jgi:hypothetical protein